MNIRKILILTFLAFYNLGNAQLIDPFGKIEVHEIKLDKNKDGSYVGAIEWTTGGVDSLQRFVINGLNVKAPVLVRIISKAPDHNIDLSFHKKKWDKVESKISTNGEKFADKIFRTMETAGLGVRSEVAGIPYLITVKVGLQFPSTQSLIRVTDDKKEYTRHLRKLGFTGELFADGNASNSSKPNSINNTSESNHILMYIIIGLLIVIALILFLFLMKRKPTQTISVLVFCLGISQFGISQNSGPRIIPYANQPDVFIGYKTENVGNQKPIPIENPRVRDASVDAGVNSNGVFRTSAPVRLESNPGARELSRQEIEDLERRMEERDNQFNQDYVENMPGKSTAGDQRFIPANPNQQELNRLRRQVEELQLQVDLLSQEDEQFEPDVSGGGEILLYCEDLRLCKECISEAYNKFTTRRGYFDFLQKFYLKKVTDLNDWIEYGNTMSSIPGGGGMAWGPILLHKVKPAMDNLKEAYNKKFDEYIELMELDLENINACYEGENGSFRSREGYEAQMFAVINALKASKIHK